jgi:IclR family transcriptional regulator, KDG regulon repressor
VLQPASLSLLPTVNRALPILDLFSPMGLEITVAHVARTLEIERSVALHMLAALEVREFVSQDPGTGRFRLGVCALDLGAL